MSVRVVACTDPFKKASTEWTEHDGVLLARVIRKLEPRYRNFRIALQLNGRPVPRHNWGQVRAKAGDLINLKVVPRFGGGPLQTAGTLALGLGSLAALYLLGGKSGEAKGETQTQNKIAPPPQTPPDPPLPPQDAYGGPKDTVMPPITGVANRTNNWGPIPNVYGFVKMFPVVVGTPYMTVEGGKQWLYVALSFGIGDIAISNLCIGSAPISDYSTDVLQWEIKTSLPLSIYTQDVDPVYPGLELVSGSAQYITAPQEALVLSIDILFNRGLYAFDRPTYTIDLNGLTVSAQAATAFYQNVAQSCSFDVGYSLEGSGVWTTQSVTFSNNTTSQYIGTLNIQVPAMGVYQVRVTKTSNDNISTFDTNAAPGTGVTYHHVVTPVQQATFYALRAIKPTPAVNFWRDANGTLVPHTIMDLKVQPGAIPGGSIQNLSAYVQRKLPTWTGSAFTGDLVTSSPAWAFIDALCGYINNSRLPRTAATVNLSDMLTWNTFCAKYGFTYSKSVDEETTIEDLLDEIASHGMASVNNVDGVYTVVVDNARTAITQMFTPDNTNNFQWTALFPEYPDGVKIKFRNAALDFQTDERTVYADGQTVNNSNTFESWDYAGITSANHAHLIAKYLLSAQDLRPIKYEFDVDPQHLVCKKGDLVKIAYDVSFDGLGTGSVISATDDGTNVLSIKLDEPMTMIAGETYGVQMRFSDHSFYSGQVVTVAGTTQTLTFTNPIPLSGAHPQQSNLVAFGNLGQEMLEAIIESIEHNEQDLSAHVTCVDYNPAIFANNDKPIPEYQSVVNLPHPATLPTLTPPQLMPGGIVTDESVILVQNGVLLSRIQISLTPPVDLVRTYIAEYRLTGTEQWLGNSTGTITNHVYISNVQDRQTYDVRILYESSVYPGLASDWTTFNAITVEGQTAPPPNILSLRLQGEDAMINLDGVPIPVDYAGVQWRWCQGTTGSWDDMAILFPLTAATSIDMKKLPPGPIVVAAKLVDLSGNQSVNAAFLEDNLTGTFVQNQIVSTLESPAWAGTKTNCSIVGGNIEADTSGAQFYGPSGSPFYSQDGTAPMYTNGWLSCAYSWTHLPNSELKKPYKIFVNHLDADGNSLIIADSYRIEYQLNSQARFYNQDGTAPKYGAPSDPAYPSDGQENSWLPFPQEGLLGSRQPYRFRILCLSSSGTRPTLMPGIGVIEDVPDVTEQINQAVSAAGSPLALTQDYLFIGPQGVQLTLNFNPLYPTAHAADVDTTVFPPFVRVYDITHTQVAGEITADVEGY